MEDMSASNMAKVQELSEAGRFHHPNADGTRLIRNSTAYEVMTCMAVRTLGWDSENNRPVAYARRNGYACRYYSSGWSYISEKLGYQLIPPDILIHGGGDVVAAARKNRENTAKKMVNNAWKFLRERGMIKTLVPASLGRNSGILLLLGDDEENRAVEAYARECLGLPFDDGGKPSWVL